MTITFDWAWWQYLLAIIGIIYLIGFVFFARTDAGLKFALIWPLFYLLGGINVQ